MPYCCYFSLALVYLLTMLHKPEETSEEWDIPEGAHDYIYTLELPIRITLFFFWLLHAVVQSL